MTGGRVVGTLIELYGSDTFDPHDQVFGSSVMSTPILPDKIAAGWLAHGISNWIGDRQVFIEATGVPNSMGWRLHMPAKGTANAEKIAHDPANVLKHVCEQTGLTCTEETRHVSRVIVTLEGKP